MTPSVAESRSVPNAPPVRNDGTGNEWLCAMSLAFKLGPGDFVLRREAPAIGTSHDKAAFFKGL